MARILFILGGLLIGAGTVGVAVRWWPVAALIVGLVFVAVAADLQRGVAT